MKLGVICPSEIAIRRFMPALHQIDGIEFVGVGVYTREERFGTKEISDIAFHESLQQEKNKAQVFLQQYGGNLYKCYKEHT